MKLTAIKLIAFLFFLCFSLTGFSQAMLAEIDFNRIPQKKIRHFIDNQINNQRFLFSDIEPSYQTSRENSSISYNLVEDAFLFRENLDKVWDSYCSTKMAESWNGKKISFGLLLSKWTDFIMYCSDHNYTELDTGQVFFVNLKLLHGIYNLAVGLEIITIDNQNKRIQFSYVKGGKSEGVQTIQFAGTNEGYTKIIHISEFRSNSKFRDKRLYPRFHKKFIHEFHENMLLNLGKTKDDLECL
jgi:hypothetical protein